MSLESRVIALAQVIGDDIQALRTVDGLLANLTTTDKTNLVAAINEVASSTAGGADLAVGVNDLVSLEVTSSTGANVTISGATAFLAGLMAAADKDKLDNVAAGATANDTDANLLSRANHTGTQTVSTISDFNVEVNALIAAVVDTAPTALDTLNEIAAALGDDANFAATMTAAISNKVSFDVAQSLSGAEQLQACQNIGVGDPEHDFVADYTTSRDS